MKNTKKICLILCAFVFMAFALNSLNTVWAGISKGDGNIATNSSVSGMTIIQEAMQAVIKFSANGIFSTISGLVVILFIALFIIFIIVFNGSGVLDGAAASDALLPFPDVIVFNKVPFLDPNFIAPHDNALVKKIGIDIIQDLFASFFTIATVIFTIAAMITGLRLVLTTIASKKAQYKEAVSKWLAGILILLCLRLLLAGIFSLNENLVSDFEFAAGDISFEINIFEAIPFFGSMLGDLFNAAGGGGKWTFSLPGMPGLVVQHLFKAIGGNVLSAFVGFILMGQSITIAIAYFKRAFMCLLLGVISPLIVAVDTFVSVQGKQSTIFKNWLKNFTITVFMQSFHAAYMVIILDFLAKMSSWSAGSEFLQSLVTIFLITGLVKMEKMLKGMFGIGDGMAGDLKDGAKSMMKAMGAVKGIGAAVNSLKDNAPKEQAAAKKKQILQSELNKENGSLVRERAIEANKQRAEDARNRAHEARNKTFAAYAKGDDQEVQKQRGIEKEALEEANAADELVRKLEAANVGANPNNNGSDSTGNNNVNQNNNENRNVNNNVNNNSGDYVQQVLNNHNNPATLSREDKIKQLQDAIKQETKNENAAKLARIMGPANLIAGIGFGLGMGDDMSETLMKGGFITAGLDRATEKIGSAAGSRKNKAFDNQQEQFMNEQSKKYGYTPPPITMNQEVIVEPKFTINPVKLAKNMVNNYKELGEVILPNTLKKDLKHIDKNLDNE